MWVSAILVYLFINQTYTVMDLKKIFSFKTFVKLLLTCMVLLMFALVASVLVFSLGGTGTVFSLLVAVFAFDVIKNIWKL